MKKLDENKIKKFLNEDFERLMSNEIIYPGPVYFMNKSSFHAVQEHHYFVIGTRLIVGPWKLNKKWNEVEKEQFFESFDNADIDHAECYKTRNAALRAVARNRKGYVHEPINNPREGMLHGLKIMQVDKQRFEVSETILLGA